MSRGQVFSQHPLQYEFQSSAIVLPILSFFYRADACVFFTHWRIRQSVSRQQNHSRILICRKIVSISIGALPDSSMGMPGGGLALRVSWWEFRMGSENPVKFSDFRPDEGRDGGISPPRQNSDSHSPIRDPCSDKVPGTDPRKSVRGGDREKIKSLIKEGRATPGRVVATAHPRRRLSGATSAGVTPQIARHGAVKGIDTVKHAAVSETGFYPRPCVRLEPSIMCSSAKRYCRFVSEATQSEGTATLKSRM